MVSILNEFRTLRIEWPRKREIGCALQRENRELERELRFIEVFNQRLSERCQLPWLHRYCYYFHYFKRLRLMILVSLFLSPLCPMVFSLSERLNSDWKTTTILIYVFQSSMKISLGRLCLSIHAVSVASCFNRTTRRSIDNYPPIAEFTRTTAVQCMRECVIAAGNKNVSCN